MRARAERSGAFAQRWWRGELGAAGALLDVALAPAEMLYRAAMALRNAAYGRKLAAAQRAALPVVSVGNVAVGGTGKTPFAQELARRLRALGAQPAIVHGGYAADEPALHRQWSAEIPVVVGRDRRRAVEQARALGANVVVLDDGFQHRRLQRELDIVLIAAEGWTRAPRLLPRGPWREPLAALRRADLIVITRKVAPRSAAERVRAELESIAAAPVLLTQLEPAGWWHDGRAAHAPAGPAMAVAALAQPRLFAENAGLAGADVVDLAVFPDHYAYTTADAAQLLRRAGERVLVTSEKDWIKLQPLLPAERVWVLGQRVRIESGEDILEARLEQIVRSARAAERRVI